jgi:hypothetical protein
VTHPDPTPAADPSPLRDRIAEAMRKHSLCTNRDEADGNMPCRCGDWREPGPMGSDEDDWDSHLADAVLAVLPPTGQRADVLLWAADRYEAILAGATAEHSSDPRYYTGVRDVILGLRRLAGEAQQQPTTETPQPDTDTCRSIDVDSEPVLVRGRGDFTEQDTEVFGEIVRAAKRKYEAEHGTAAETPAPAPVSAAEAADQLAARHHADGWDQRAQGAQDVADLLRAGEREEQAPAAAEDAQRADRRETIHVLLARLDRGNFTPGECRAIRERVETEIREHDTMRAVARSNRRHVQVIAPEIDRLTDGLEDAETQAAGFLADLKRAWGERDGAQAAIERVRERCQGVRDRSGPGGMINATQILGLLSPTWPDGNYEAPAPADALDGTEQPTGEAP